MVDAGLLLAYSVIGTMAVAPIYFGSFDSLDRLKSSYKKKARPQFAEFSDSEDEDDSETESVSAEDAYMFPVYGILNKDWVNVLLSGYFAIMGVAALSQVSVKVVKSVAKVKLPLYHVHIVHKSKSIFSFRFSNLHIAMLGTSAVVTGFYLWSKNWIVSNLFGLAFSFSAIGLIRLDSFKSGMIMLGGLFAYDIFWVFGTEVMVSVAKNFDAPIKVVFPKELLPADGALKFTMLGLGDIVVPGIFVALCLRFDRHRYLARLGYAKDKHLPDALGGRHHGFLFPDALLHAAQPALLYLSPACTLSVIITAMIRGELGAVFAYSEDTKSENEKENADDKEDVSEQKALGVPSVADAPLRKNLHSRLDSPTPGSGMTPTSAGEMADDEQEGIRARKVLDEKVDPISDMSDNESEAVSKKKKKGKGKGQGQGSQVAM
ncbi:hypothetical protein DL89DRAFT_253979 [Linderina pennispora]|uniref:Peptidase A22B, signal peptide peptidase n=1 Tax=Linderina pennispora TaxID=61395 RepID=A0A1Y1WKJ0_9FUNG|nr:uncharacterized protein DL89DRAFT_253979 [Linderina pennispora]ORX74090.1 hypothetical protein DL89DRAFT_253979 [Linderina pennispora]